MKQKKVNNENAFGEMNTYKIAIRKIWQIGLWCVGVAAISGGMQSCTSSEEPYSAPQDNTLTLCFSTTVDGGSIHTRAAVADTEAERTVDNVAVWAFNAQNKCLYCRYFSSFQSDAQVGQDGTFNLLLPDWVDGAVSILVSANLTAAIQPDNYVGQNRDDFVWSDALRCAVASTDAPVLRSSLPMSCMISVSNGDKKVNVQLRRSVVKFAVDVQVLDATLGSRLKLDQAEVFFSNLTGHAAIANAYENGIYSVSPAASAVPPVYNTRWTLLSSLATTPVYALQRTFPGTGIGGDWGPVELSLRIPYTKDDGNVDENNYYRTAITNTGETGARQHWLFPNSLYRIALQIVGVGTDGLGRVDIDCLPWNTEDVAISTGHSLALKPDVYVSSASPVALRKAGYLTMDADYPTDEIMIRASGRDAVDITVEKTTVDGKIDWVVTQVGGQTFTETPASQLQNASAWQTYARQSVADKEIKLEVRGKNSSLRQVANVHLNTVQIAGNVWMDRELGAGNPQSTGYYFYPFASPYGSYAANLPVTSQYNNIPAIPQDILNNRLPDWSAEKDNPCPAGYRIPTKTELLTIMPMNMDTNFPDMISGGLKFSAPGLSQNQIFYQPRVAYAEETATGVKMCMMFGPWCNLPSGVVYPTATTTGDGELNTAIIMYYFTSGYTGFRHNAGAAGRMTAEPMSSYATSDAYRIRCIKK